MAIPVTAPPRVEFQDGGLPVAQPLYQVDQTGAIAPGYTGGVNTTQCTPTSATIIKASAGRLCKILVSAANSTNPILIYDNASATSGTVIGDVAASAAVGTLYDLQMPAQNGITIAATASAGTITVSWS